jgi:hypothetical protein
MRNPPSARLPSAKKSRRAHGRSIAFLVAQAAASIAMAQAPAAPASLSTDADPSLPYIVKASDKLINLSRQMLVSPAAWNEVARFNQLKNPNVIIAGQRINVPLRLLKSQPSGGKVISAEGDVTLGGGAAQPGAAIGDGSQIKTGANSSAVIEIGDGSRIKLLPNSVAQIISNRDYAMRDASASGSTNWFSGLLRLASGTLEAMATKNVHRATPLRIETPTSVVGVRGTEFRVAFDDPATNAARTEVIEGKVRADNPAQQSGADLPMGTGAVVKPAEREIKVALLLPAPDLSATPAEVLKPAGAWPMPTLAGAAAYRVQVSSDAAFDKITRDLKVTTASADLGSLASGNWYARVRGIDAAGLEGFNTVKLIAVKDGRWRVSYSSLTSTGGQTILSFIGQDPSGLPFAGGAYSVQVARDAAFTQAVPEAQNAAPVADIPGRDPRVSLGKLQPGTYYLRLASRTAQGTMESETYRIELPASWGRTVFDITAAMQSVN